MKEKVFALIKDNAPEITEPVKEVIDETDLISQLEYDSLSTIKLLIAIEEEFEIEIDFDDFDFELLVNAGKFAGYIISKVSL